MGEVVKLRPKAPVPAVEMLAPATAVFLALRSLCGDDVCATDVIAFMRELGVQGYVVAPHEHA